MKRTYACSLVMLLTMPYLWCAANPPKVESDSESSFEKVEEAPVLLNKVVPEYPANALDMMMTGTIWVKALVDKLGNVTEAMVLRDVGENITFFRQSAIDAAMKTKWKPARSNGKPIAVWVTYRVDFDFK